LAQSALALAGISRKYGNCVCVLLGMDEADGDGVSDLMRHDGSCVRTCLDHEIETAPANWKAGAVLLPGGCGTFPGGEDFWSALPF